MCDDGWCLNNEKIDLKYFVKVRLRKQDNDHSSKMLHVWKCDWKQVFVLSEKVIELKKDKNLNHENIQYLTNDEMDQNRKNKDFEKSIEGQVLDELKLTKQCCRRHMLTHVDVFS